MESNRSSRTDTGKTDWQLFGEFKLPIGREPDSVVKTWLVELLIPLDLHPGFFNQILKSMLEAAKHALQPGLVVKVDHIHLLVFTPIDLNSNGKTWGFFRIEKIDSLSNGMLPATHIIEFYLYLEGQEAAHF